jgi:hypothetical protein
MPETRISPKVIFCWRERAGIAHDSAESRPKGSRYGLGLLERPIQREQRCGYDLLRRISATAIRVNAMSTRAPIPSGPSALPCRKFPSLIPIVFGTASMV